MDGFTRGLAKEVATQGIRVVAIAPGVIDTPFYKDRELLAKFAASIPMGRVGKPVEIAKMAVFLASDEASYTTGRIFDVSGGYVI